jgi:hypothetical protein
MWLAHTYVTKETLKEIEKWLELKIIKIIKEIKKKRKNKSIS